MSRGQCERGRAERGDGEKLAGSCAHYRIENPGLNVLLCILEEGVEDSGKHKVQNDQFSYWCFQPQEGQTHLVISSPQRQRPANPGLCPVDWGSPANSLAVTAAPSLPIKTCFFFCSSKAI